MIAFAGHGVQFRGEEEPYFCPADARLKSFLIEVGRRKYIKPLYQELAKTPEGKERAREIYKTSRAGYHPIAVTTIDDLLK